MPKSSDVAAKAPAIIKAVSLLDELARSSDGVSVSNIARRINVPKSSVADLCATLSAHGLVARDGDGRYLLGRHIVEIARGLVGGRRFVEVFAEACDGTMAARDETVTMSIRDGADIVIIAARHGRATLPITVRAGLHLPVWSTASGRCFLSHLSETGLAEVLAGGSVTSAGVSGRMPALKQLCADLQAERRQGVYVDDQRTATGMISFGAPVSDGHSDRIVASIAIATRSGGLTPQRAAELGLAAQDVAAACLHLSERDR